MAKTKPTPKTPPKGITTKGALTIAGIVAVVAGGAYVAINHKKLFGKKDALPPPVDTSKNSAAAQAAAATSNVKPGAAATTPNTILAKGSKGDEVKRLQRFLNEEYRQSSLFSLARVKAPAKPMLETQTSIFGEKTEAELLKQYGKTAITVAELDKWIKETQAKGDVVALF